MLASVGAIVTQLSGLAGNVTFSNVPVLPLMAIVVGLTNGVFRMECCKCCGSAHPWRGMYKRHNKRNFVYVRLRWA
jgi:hypothetical protein